VGLPYWEVNVNPGNYIAYTDQLGNYLFNNIPEGTYTVSEVLQTNWTQTCPVPIPPGEYQNVVVTAGQFVSGKDFGNYASSPTVDLACYVGGGPARPGFYKSYGITYQNNGNVPSEATVVLTLPADVVFIYCSPGGVYNAGAGTVTWNINTFPPGWTDWLTVTVLIPASVPLGTTLTSSARILPEIGDANPADNLASETQTVTGSYDPNEKLVSPEGVIQRTDMLTYQINFQNVGTDTAFNIIVRDTLDPNLDISTFTSGASIHPYTYAITGREISWIFPDINLPDSIVNEAASHGFVKFTAFPMPGVPAGTFIENRASIFFDFNPPVITNTVSNQIASPPPCAYIPGDINSNGQANGIDVTYGVSYLKGGNAPRDSCDCPPMAFPFYASMDVNGNCAANGIDITYFVSYLKGQQPALLYCQDCPPAGRASPPMPTVMPTKSPEMKIKAKINRLE